MMQYIYGFDMTPQGPEDVSSPPELLVVTPSKRPAVAQKDGNNRKCMTAIV